MSGHIHSGASSHECALVRALAYATPSLLDYSPQGVYRARAPVGTWPSTQRNHHLGGSDPWATDRQPSRVGPRLGQPGGRGQTPVALAAQRTAGPPPLGRRRAGAGAAPAAPEGQSALGAGLDDRRDPASAGGFV